MKVDLKWPLKAAQESFDKNAEDFKAMCKLENNGIDCPGMIKCIENLLGAAWMIRDIKNIEADKLRS